jgi:hypothetical protein
MRKDYYPPPYLTVIRRHAVLPLEELVKYVATGEGFPDHR